MWSSSSLPSRSIGYSNLAAAPDMGMLGLRDVFVVAPASSFHQQHEPIVSTDMGMASGLGVGVSVLPLLTSLGPPNIGMEEANLMMSRGRGGGGGGGGIQYHGNIDGFGFASGSSPTSGTGTCHDCGNQAKKDCSHRRCRSCCKSRGFDCATHIKSTWVPAARRRERQMLTSADAVAAGTSSGSTSGGKKPRLIASQTTTNSHTSTSNTPSRSLDTSSDMSYKKAKLPDQVRAPAVFKCVRVTAVEGGGGGGNEYAYQAVVKIGGHVFKGYLYDHGVEAIARDGFPMLSDLHLGGGGDGGSTSSPVIHPADVYASSGGGGLAGGSTYGNPIN